MKSNKKLTPLEKEKLLDQEEIIEFYYHDKESKTKILIKDKRKIKVALMEMDEYERKQRNDIMEFECPYNAKTDDPVAEDNYDEIEYEQTEFEQNLEDALQEMVNKMSEIQDSKKKILKFFENNILEFTERQLIIIFLKYYLDFPNIKIADVLNLDRSSITKHLERIDKKFNQIKKKSSQQNPLI